MTKSRWFKISLIGLSTAAVAAAGGACSTSDAGSNSAGSGGTSTSGGTGNSGGTTPTAGSSPIAGSTSTGGTGGAVGTGGSAGGGVVPMGVACPKATVAALTDFTNIDGGTPGNFGVVGTTFAGGTFQFPATVTADFSADNWHLTGMVGDYAAFALFFQDCTEVDASMFKGISFTVKGSIPSPLTPNTISFQVGTAADDVSSDWLNTHKTDPTVADVAPSFGRCMPVSPTNRYDGTCGSPSFTVAVTDTATPVTILWTDLKGGKPAASVNPAEITSIIWGLPAPAGAGTANPPPTPYALDVTIDDLAFVP